MMSLSCLFVVTSLLLEEEKEEDETETISEKSDPVGLLGIYHCILKMFF